MTMDCFLHKNECISQKLPLLETCIVDIQQQQQQRKKNTSCSPASNHDTSNWALHLLILQRFKHLFLSRITSNLSRPHTPSTSPPSPSPLAISHCTKLRTSHRASPQPPRRMRQRKRTFIRIRCFFARMRSRKVEVPKGHMAVNVGAEEARFVIPIAILNHPLFQHMLKQSEEAFGFDHKGALSFPCHTSEFLDVICMLCPCLPNDTKQYRG